MNRGQARRRRRRWVRAMRRFVVETEAYVVAVPGGPRLTVERLAREVRPVNEKKRRRRCNTPTKDVYHHKAEAEHAARNAAAGYGWAMDAYECRGCHFWHITRVKTKTANHANRSEGATP